MADTYVLGIDTSNYTSSAAVYDAADGRVIQSKQLLPVKEGEKGVRQSDAVFHHTVLLPQMLDALSDKLTGVTAVGVSDRPSCRKDSYMPCFLVGLGTAKAIATARGVRYHTTTHQTGHILAALYSADSLDLVKQKREFIAFHVSGGTTDMLLCRYDEDKLLDIARIGGSSDLKAGQAIDRCGVMLGLRFPCGGELEALAEKSSRDFNVKVPLKDLECSLSGVENKCRQMLEKGEPYEDIARFCLTYVCAAVKGLTQAFYEKYGSMKIIYAGGVMSNMFIRGELENKDRFFCAPEFSKDNACGVAVCSAIKKGYIDLWAQS